MIHIDGLRKRYPDSEDEVLKGIDLGISEGEFVSLVGRSGCGKTTLLSIIGGLDSTYEGSARVDGSDLSSLGDVELAHFRRRTVGFVFQAYHLLDHLTCAENVALAARFGPGDTPWPSDQHNRATEVLDLVGLREMVEHRPTRLSGGERQRVAIARALFGRPRLLLLDEPTGNLDTATGAEVLELLSSLHTSFGLTILAATHDAAIEGAGHRLVRLSDGRLVDGSEASP